MSMISAQIDELRELTGDGSMEWVTCPIRASVLRDAADTIWQLRDDLQLANAENAKLRQQLADVTESMGRVEERCAKTFEVGKRWMAKAARFEAENEKLRELVKELWEGYQDPPCDGCQLKGKPVCADCPICAREALVIDHLRELGVEVDGG